METRLRFPLDFYPQTALKLSSETQVAFLPFFLEIIVVYFDFPQFFPEVLKVVDFDFLGVLIVVHFNTLPLQVLKSSVLNMKENRGISKCYK